MKHVLMAWQSPTEPLLELSTLALLAYTPCAHRQMPMWGQFISYPSRNLKYVEGLRDSAYPRPAHLSFALQLEGARACPGSECAVTLRQVDTQDNSAFRMRRNAETPFNT